MIPEGNCFYYTVLFYLSNKKKKMLTALQELRLHQKHSLLKVTNVLLSSCANSGRWVQIQRSAGQGWAFVTFPSIFDLTFGCDLTIRIASKTLEARISKF